MLVTNLLTTINIVIITFACGLQKNRYKETTPYYGALFHFTR